MFNVCLELRVSLIGLVVAAALLGTEAEGQPAAAQRGALARLVKTPADSPDLPPYALADQNGAIQRYVEPVEGIDLEPFVDQVVSVRHDTGETLLASQLVLPQSPLMAMVGEGYRGGAARLVQGNGARRRSDSNFRLAEFVDNDDTTVELVEEGQSLPAGGVVEGGMPMGAMPMGAIYPDGTPVGPGGQMAPGMPMIEGGSMYYDGQQFGPPMQQPGGGFAVDPAFSQPMGFVQPFGQKPAEDRPHFYGDIDINFLRAHVPEETFGKLSEKYEFSPRFVLGFVNVGGLSGRARYWLYGRGVNGLNIDDSVHIEMDVFDLEATHLIAGRRSQVELAAGLRLAGIEFEDSVGAACGTDLVGMSMAADGWTPIYTCRQGCVGWAYGGRLSLLAGDWGGDANSTILNRRIRDDNVVVHELYAGIGFTHCFRGCDLNAMIDFEMQNWHSDVLSMATGGDTLGFVGPGVRIGAEF